MATFVSTTDPCLEVSNGVESLPAGRCREIHRLMVRSRIMEERMIKMSKSGEGYIWIGGPGEEAFNTCLGLQVHKGEGPDYDYLHLHYRSSATLVAMGMPPIDFIRQMAMTATDPHSMGRNFPGHYAYRPWNVTPVSSVIEIKYVVAVGTAIIQKRRGSAGITIVSGGDAGTAEGDFASCLVWSSRPGNELPILMIVTNNGWGISTSASSQHGEQRIADRGQAFGIPGAVVDGNDPIASWHALRRAREYCRTHGRPYLLEAMVSRLYGHSSSSGTTRVTHEPDGLALFEKQLLHAGALASEDIQRIHDEAHAEVEAAVEQALSEPRPQVSDIPRYAFAASPVDTVYPEDYTELPD